MVVNCLICSQRAALGKKLTSAFVVFLSLFFLVSAVQASSLVAVINVSEQQMIVSRNGKEIYRWKTSTARRGYITPIGQFTPQRMHLMWYSRKYNNAPMPYAIFYHKGYAVHGTSAVAKLGKPASHGCIRLQTENAKKFYYLVQDVGQKNTTIIVRP